MNSHRPHPEETVIQLSFKKTCEMRLNIDNLPYSDADKGKRDFVEIIKGK